MSDTFPSAGQVDNLEHTDENHAKKVNSYVWNSGSGVWKRMTQPGGSSSGKAMDAYAIQAKSDDGTYIYYFRENATPDYAIMRKNKTTGVWTFAKGTGSYAAVYVSPTAGPSGSPTFDTYGNIF